MRIDVETNEINDDQWSMLRPMLDFLLNNLLWAENAAAVSICINPDCVNIYIFSGPCKAVFRTD